MTGGFYFQWTLLLTEISQTRIGFRVWVSNYIHARRCRDLISYLSPNFNGSLTGSSLKLGHGWVLKLEICSCFTYPCLNLKLTRLGKYVKRYQTTFMVNWNICRHGGNYCYHKQVSYQLVSPWQPICRLGTHGFPFFGTDIQISCSDLTRMVMCRDNNLSNGLQGTWPTHLLYILLPRNKGRKDTPNAKGWQEVKWHKHNKDVTFE